LQADRYPFGPKILGQSKAIWFGLEIVLGKVLCFYLIQKLIDRSKTYWFGPLIIGTKAKRFDLVRLLSERKQNNLICSLSSRNYLSKNDSTHRWVGNCFSWRPYCVGGPVVAFIPAVACVPAVVSGLDIAVILKVAWVALLLLLASWLS
jgi:hypothetical protein